MNKSPIFAAAAALLSLAACNENKPEEVSAIAPDPQAEALKNAPKVELPPAIAASVAMRCGDNSLVYVDFFQGDKMALLRTVKGGAATTLKAANAGEPYVADGGYKITGTSKSATVVTPNQGTRTCHA
ncbi:MAG: hypothetical protein KF730_06415 [Sphingomonas sp.]|uniref:hypothetical protein n=1 Tax=Sphingomonas sp. TaxID=28214 RepID=UPI0025DE924C|nr:hypothetical protein [Sphingomonas sp.]MBX3564196.1 hypothetical protein [Sphingomonas sp.]